MVVVFVCCVYSAVHVEALFYHPGCVCVFWVQYSLLSSSPTSTTTCSTTLVGKWSQALQLAPTVFHQPFQQLVCWNLFLVYSLIQMVVKYGQNFARVVHIRNCSLGLLIALFPPYYATGFVDLLVKTLEIMMSSVTLCSHLRPSLIHRRQLMFHVSQNTPRVYLVLRSTLAADSEQGCVSNCSVSVSLGDKPVLSHL